MKKFLLIAPAAFVVALSFIAGRFSATPRASNDSARVWVGQSEADMRRALGKPLDESDVNTDLETISGRLHCVRYRCFVVTLKHGRVHTIDAYPYSSFDPTPEELKKPVD